MTDQTSNTGNNRQNKGQFKKGDPRINRGGRPKNFDEARKLALSLSSEVVLKDGKPVIVNGHKLTVAEAIFRRFAQSHDPKIQQIFLEYAFGKVKTTTEITGKDGEQIELKAKIDVDDIISRLLSEPSED